MRTTTLTALFALALAVAIPSSEARADVPQAAKDEASQRFKSGVAFYNDRDFTAAMVEFKRAYELVPNYAVLFNLGQTARELKDYAAALAAFEQYLRDGGAKIDAKRKGTVQASIDELRRKIGKIKITSNVDGAEIAIDDVRVGATPIADAVVVNVGKRKVTATLSGYNPAQKLIEIAGTAESTVAFDLTKIEVVPPPIDPSQDPASKPGIPVVAWVTLSATGAAAIITAVMGGLAVSSRSSLKDALATFPGDGVAIAEAQSRTRTFAVATDVFIGLTAAGAAATTVLFVLASRSGEKPGEKPKPTTSFGISPTGFVLRGSF